MARLLTLFVLLALSANLAWGQRLEPVPCSVVQSQWSNAVTENRSLEENRSYGTGHRVGSPVSVNRDMPQGWLFPEYKIVNQQSPKSFYIDPFSGQLFTYLQQSSNGSLAFDYERKPSYTLPVKASLVRTRVRNGEPYYVYCHVQTITVNVSISDEPESPPRPRAPRVTGVHGSLTVSWNPVVINPKISSYDVQYRISFKPFANGPQGVIGTSATIENLNPQFNYQVRIRATNARGVSPWSPTTPARTTPAPKPPPDTDTDPDPEPDPDPGTDPDPDSESPPPDSDLDPDPDPYLDPDSESPPGSGQRVPGRPTNLLAVAGDEAVTLTWDAPEDGGSAITDYQYRINRRFPWISIGSTTTHTLTGLVNGQVYIFEVRAVNEIGKSHASIRAEATPEAPPTLDFAHFDNGTGIISELVLVNVATHSILPVIYFFDQQGQPIDPQSVVDIMGDLGITDDGGLTVWAEMEPLGELTISTHGRGALVTGSVRVVSDGPIGGGLRYNLPDIGVAGVGASLPLSDVIFPVRRQEGGINTWAALHYLESSPGVVRCDLMREGMLLDTANFFLEANGQASWFIDQAFRATDTSNFAGSVRCDAMGDGLFSAVALEMDPGNRIFTTLPVVQIPEMPDRE